MFTRPINTELSPELIRDAIDANELDRARFNRLENYYLGKHEISYRYKKDTLINNKIVINHAKYITDINTGYLLGNPISYMSDLEIEGIIEEYRKQTISDLDHEIAKDLSVFGRAYELDYTSGNEVRSAIVDVRNCVCVYDDTINHKMMFAITYQKNSDKPNKYDDIVVYDEGFIYNYVQNGEIRLNTITPHYFDRIPLIEYRNNSELMGDFEQVIPLIDAYNLIQSDRVNDKEQLVDALMIVYGMQLTPEQRYSMKNSRVMHGLDKDTKVEYLTKQLNEADADTLRKVIENDIHKISMTPNLTDENFAGNSSGVAIRYKLIAFEQSVINKERYFEKGLKERFQIYNNYLNKLKGIPIIPIYEVDAVFKRNLPQNDLETSQMINNLSSYVDKETLLSQLSFVDDVAKVIEAKEVEQEKETKLDSEYYNNDEAVIAQAKQGLEGEVEAQNNDFLSKVSRIIKGEA